MMYVTEDTTRETGNDPRALHHRDSLRRKSSLRLRHRGPFHADGARAVMRFVKSIIDEQGGNIRLDWHGHQDRGLGVINSLAAIQAGADQVHGSALGNGRARR